MVDAQSKRWRRIPDWVSLIAGLYLATTPAQYWAWETGTAGKAAMAIIGVAIAGMALIALARPGAYIDEGMIAASGVIAFIAPWLFSYTGATWAALTSWIVGTVLVISALAALPTSWSVHQHQHHPA